MKKIHEQLLVLAVAGVVMLSACSQKAGPTEPPVTTEPGSTAPASTAPPATAAPPTTEPVFEGVEFERRQDDYVLQSTDGADLIRLSVAIPSIESLPGVNDYYSSWAGDVEFNISLELPDVQAVYEDSKSIGRNFYPHSFTADFEVMRNDSALFSVMREITSETGGAHGATLYIAENFILASGALLTMDDLFSVPQSEYYDRIKSAVLEKIHEKYGGAESAGSVLYGNYESTLMDVYDPKNFCVSESGVIFFWQEYDLGPYAAGAQIYEIELDALADIIREEWIK